VEKVKAIDRILERRLRLEGRIWRTIMIYNNSSMNIKKAVIEDMLEDSEEEMLCIGEDFNSIIGKEGKRIKGKEDEVPWRNSKHKEVKNEEKEFLGLVEDRRRDIRNGNMRGVEEGELTYIGGREESVVNYVLVNQKAWDKIEKWR